jgi:hypothetical protein
MSTITVDHIILAVLDRDVAADDFRSLGFNVIAGGTHTDGHTHNNLIPLLEGPYIELVAPTDVRDVRVKHEDHGRHWLYCFNAGEGFAGYAFLTHDFEGALRRVTDAGFPLHPRREGGGRRQPNGRVTESRGLSVLEKRYPSVVADVTPREWRIEITRETATHANGVTGIAQVVASVRNLEEATKRYSTLLGVEPRPGSPVDGAKTVDFRVENSLITIAEPTDKTHAVYEDLERRGEVPFILRLRTNDPTKVGRLDFSSTHWARLELVSGNDL